jgi:hypothetical protein
VRTLRATPIVHCDAVDPVTRACTRSTPLDGVQVIARAARMFVDPAQWKGLRDRQGRSYALRNDGGQVPQTTPLYIALGALRRIDAALAQAPDGADRLQGWRTARSRMLDRLFSVEGDYGSERFTNRAVPVVLPRLIELLRAQIGASCETCSGWASPTASDPIRPAARSSLVQNIIDNLTRQHKELTRITMKFVQQLETVGRGGTSEAYKSLHTINGILRVHIAMEDRSFYPYLLDHREPVLRELAQRFLSERELIQEKYDAWLERWPSIATIDAAPHQFVAETREILMTLGTRMFAEDRELHPAIRKHFDS